MKKLFPAFSFIFSLIVLPVQAETSSTEKTAIINELLEITQAENTAKLMGKAVVQNIYAGLKQANPNIPPRTLKIIEEVTIEMVEEDINSPSFREDIQRIYSKHFTTDELKEIVIFYKTPVGQKAISKMPLIIQESTANSQNKLQKIMPKIMLRLAKRFKEEGIEL
ncbi:DUF2059 domain-containing protein [Kiloniella litopenaei]|uniref:DUF2059 domain-containing protein n=1 Tax=Kiloniella litopenaei TaxID=1549748 RepID=UPI000698976E|nr:DUF2059 domain-containing protein [Kiloniella litopenaei]